MTPEDARALIAYVNEPRNLEFPWRDYQQAAIDEAYRLRQETRDRLQKRFSTGWPATSLRLR